MKRLMLILAWIAVIVTAVFLRFDDLERRPMHADEATGARITAKRMEGTGGQFNPTHYHGPLLADLTIPVCRLRGEGGWREMSKLSLRLVPAVAGCLLVLVPLLWRRRGGDLPALLAAALLATSPLLVYYSRMFIHESLLVLAGLAALACIRCRPCWGLPGLMVGLMFAAKESFVISLLAWGGAALILAVENRRHLDRAWCRATVERWWRPVAISAGMALLTMLAFYTHGFTHMKGAVDAVRTFFIYETVEGHDKSWDYYLELWLMPKKALGLWWFGTPVVLLAMLAYGMSFSRQLEDRQRRWIRFLAYSALGHGVIYSAFAYKTPWLACLPWAHVCWLAGFSLVSIPRSRRWVQVVAAIGVGACLLSQWRQARSASGDFDSNARNPFAYVPTRSDIESVENWMIRLREMESGVAPQSVAVIGRGYWPLPWYLRSFERVGYWAVPVDGLEAFPLLLVMPEQFDAMWQRLEGSHYALPRGLRAEVPVHLFVSHEVFDAWMQSDSP